ncbi:MAG TPA: non-ribosomal peptide synthetase [Steroidobacteraceae bacterium]|nr:non-ribosomal peptide synthetase [Steroidobacteraceae bacterium]
MHARTPNATALIAGQTLNAVLEANRGAARSVTYLEGERETRVVSLGELYERALGILHRLQRLGARPGDKLILFLSSNEPFVDAFWAALLGGIIAVPVAPGISDEHRRKLLRIARKLGAPYIYTEQRLLERLAAQASSEHDLATLAALRTRAFLVDELEQLGRSGKPYRPRPADVAFIQFSSGSTSEPKGVVLTHANLLANIRAIAQTAQFTADDVSLSWMPLTHDMGLIGFHLTMLANRIDTHLMPTDLFVRRPLLWLQYAARVRASILCSPNFGYRHYLKVLGERAAGELDLSQVRLIFNGAEPISVELCDEFLSRLAPTGLARHAMYPVYGLAEASLAVSFPEPGRPYRATAFNRHELGVGAQPQTVGVNARDAVRLASVGRAIPSCQLRIADDDDRPLPGERVGHIHIRGDNVTGGYYEDAAANAETFTSDGWLRTGDLGLMHEGELYITGRHKEILFVNGQNYYPHDLEHIAENVPGLELGKVVVAGVRPAGAQADELLVFVLHRADMAEFLPLARRVAARIGEHTGLPVSAVVPVRRIPKTTSGKFQRHLLEQEYLDGAFSAELAELDRLRAQEPAARVGGSEITQQLRAICEQELEGRSIDPDQSLFDIGASSLKLIAIHERIERLWPGLVDVTDIFDHPSIGELASFIEQKLAAAAPS